MSPFRTIKQLYRCIPLLLLISAATLQANAQSAPVVAIDSLTGKPSAGFTFDAPFELKYSLPGGIKASSAALFKVTNTGCLGNMLSKECTDIKLKTAVDALKLKIANETDPVKRKDLKKQLKKLQHSALNLPLTINKQNGADVYVDMPALEPNEGYRVFIFTSPAKVDGLEDILNLMATDTVTAEKDYNILAAKYTTVIKINNNPCAACKTITFRVDPFPNFSSQYKNNWKQPWADLLAERAISKKLKVPFAGTKPTGGYDAKYGQIISDFLAYAQECIKCDTKAPQYQVLSKSAVNVPVVLISLKEMQNPLIYNGDIDLSQLYATIPDPDVSPESRVTNLTNSILELQTMAALSDYFKYKYNYANAALKDFDAYISGAITTDEANLTALKTFQKTLADEAAKLKKMEADFTTLTASFFNLPVNSVRSDTWTYNFDTRAGYMIRSDFGFMAYGNPWNNPGLKGFLPYIGFHVNLRPMNTDIPFSQIPNKNIWNYLSLNAGAVIGSLSKAGVRDGLVGGTSIYTGLGVNFSHEFRLTFGGVWYRKYDPNPLIDKKTAAATPYIGLSMDFRLKDIYNGFKSIFEP